MSCPFISAPGSSFIWDSRSDAFAGQFDFHGSGGHYPARSWRVVRLQRQKACFAADLYDSLYRRHGIVGRLGFVLIKWVALSRSPDPQRGDHGMVDRDDLYRRQLCLSGGLVFYNALLPSVSTPRTMGRVSGYGVAVGYFGSAIGLLVARVFVDGTFLGRKIASLEGGGPAASFLPTALLFIVFAVPIFIFVSEPPLPAAGKRSWNLRKSYRRVWTSLRDTQKYPGLLRFLVAKFFYEDSIETVIIFMGVFTQKVMGFTLSQTNTFFFSGYPRSGYRFGAVRCVDRSLWPEKNSGVCHCAVDLRTGCGYRQFLGDRLLDDGRCHRRADGGDLDICQAAVGDIGARRNARRVFRPVCAHRQGGGHHRPFDLGRRNHRH